MVNLTRWLSVGAEMKWFGKWNRLTLIHQKGISTILQVEVKKIENNKILRKMACV